LQEASGQVEKGKSELTKQIAELKVREAQMKAEYDSLSAALVKQEAQLILKQAQQGIDEQGNEVETDRKALSSQVTEAVAAMQAQAAQFMTDVAKVITQIQATAQPQVYMQNKPTRRVGRTKRVNGELISIIEDMPDEAA
jgi:predicted  nucleic acid-binding Zn-ribbon protein